MDLTFSLIIISFYLHEISAFCTIPEDSNTKMEWHTCRINDPIKYHALFAVDKHGKAMHKFTIDSPFTVVADIYNRNGVMDNLKSKVKVWRWTGQKYHCYWRELPTFKAFDNLLRCNETIKCPLKPGRQIIRFDVDLSAFSQIAAFWPKNSAYRIRFETHTANSSQSSTCLIFESLIELK
ncbi:unnamed protein product [Thelazia callipaeda]|uniref:ML domain-containing protein n=1 Tax=Thelazia callipaeda TaxID=103827 RepID=A0A0N5D2C8_THECL|nr:unnamed protein product [Thelazia callipaeda]